MVQLVVTCCVACTASRAAGPTQPSQLPEPDPSHATPRSASSARPSAPAADDLEPTTSQDGVRPPPLHPDDAHASRDVRIEGISALGPRWEVACNAFGGEPCRLRADFDGDGRLDEALKIRETTTKHAGIAIEWADSSVSLVAADSGTAIVNVDFDFVDGFDRSPVYELSWDYGRDDLAFLEGWRVMPDLTGPQLGSDEPGKIPVPAAVGDGIRIHGHVLFYDGDGWRLLALI